MWPLTLVQISAIPAHLEESHESGVFFVPSFPAVRQIAAHVMALAKEVRTFQRQQERESDQRAHSLDLLQQRRLGGQPRVCRICLGRSKVW